MDLRRITKSLLLDLRKPLRMFRQLDREAFAAHYLQGTGIEIGALHNPLRVPAGTRVRYVDRMSREDLRKQYPELSGRDFVNVDVIDNGELLTSIRDDSQDFVIANHFFEHCENPFGALQHLFRVIRPGGLLFMAIPDKNQTFDAGREVTPLDHVVRDFREGPEWCRVDHFRDWVRHVEHIQEADSIEKRAAELIAQQYSIHYHVWTLEALVDLFRHAPLIAGLRFDIECIQKSEGEVVTVLRKTEQS